MAVSEEELKNSNGILTNNQNHNDLKTIKNTNCNSINQNSSNQNSSNQNSSNQNSSNQNLSNQNSSNQNSSNQNSSSQNLSNQNSSSQNSSNQNSSNQNSSNQNSLNQNSSNQNSVSQNTTDQNSISHNSTNQNSTNQNLNAEFQLIKANLIFLNHQVTQVMRAFNVSNCCCEHCNSVQLIENTNNLNVNKNYCLSKINDSTNIKNCSSEKKTNDIRTKHQSLFKKLSSSDSLRFFIPKRNFGGRKSKYCSPTQKKVVARYAQQHGATAAARRFNIPPTVAAYYHRKEYKTNRFFAYNQSKNLPLKNNFIKSNNEKTEEQELNNLNKTNDLQSFENSEKKNFTSKSHKFNEAMDVSLLNENSENLINFQNFSNYLQPNSENSVGQKSLCLNKTDNNISETNQINNLNNNNEMDNSSNDVWNSLEKNSSQNSSLPGFLRGRGRGRPKLIGDELDAELVEYMVQLKTTKPHVHLTAAYALNIARAYIAEKAPGLLEEHGGQVKLKLTWAMKLVTRVQEREREIQLGLPAGTLQNMGKTNLSNISTGLMNGLLSQNFFGQQNLKGLEATLNSENQVPTTSYSIPSSLAEVFTSSTFTSTSNLSLPSSTTTTNNDAIVKTSEISNNKSLFDFSSAAAIASFFGKSPISFNSSTSSNDFLDPAILFSDSNAKSLVELTAQNDILRTIFQSFQRVNENQHSNLISNNEKNDSITQSNESLSNSKSEVIINDAF